jgi:UDP-4-amino-4-deoxy-L-arabinose-oxoglutarate aminotransferase
MTNFQAALLIPQLARLDALWQRRDDIARRYEAAFGAAGIQTPRLAAGDNKSARHLFTIWVDEGRRDRTLDELQDAGVGAAVNYQPIHTTAYYRRRFGYSRGDFPSAERIGSRTISLPLYPDLKDDEVAHVVESVVRICAMNETIAVERG